MCSVLKIFEYMTETKCPISETLVFMSGNYTHIRSAKIKIYRTIILPIVLYGCETWPLTFREECRLRVFENKVLRRIFGPKRDEVTGEWRRLHNK
jgi:hypothetical protein